MYSVKPNKNTIDDILNRCSAKEEEGGSNVPGMTYEQGVKAGIEWVIGDTESSPLE